MITPASSEDSALPDRSRVPPYGIEDRYGAVRICGRPPTRKMVGRVAVSRTDEVMAQNRTARRGRLLAPHRPRRRHPERAFPW